MRNESLEAYAARLAAELEPLNYPLPDPPKHWLSESQRRIRRLEKLISRTWQAAHKAEEKARVAHLRAAETERESREEIQRILNEVAPIPQRNLVQND